jgi:hypothetical protein
VHPAAVVFDELAEKNRRAESNENSADEEAPAGEIGPERVLVPDQIDQLEPRIAAFQREIAG